MFDQIPLELRERKQWCSVDIEPDADGKLIKVPYVSNNCKKAASTRPAEWRSFEEALADVQEGRRQHLGFFLSADDPYFFIDLDDPSDPDQQKVLERFDTYMQRSVSGTGIHIIGKGKFEGSGKHPRNPAAGLFQQDRYILFTGDVINNKTTITTVDNDDLQSIHDWLSSAKDYPAVELEDVEPTHSDEEVFQAGCRRFDKFDNLTEARWEQYSEYRDSRGNPDHSSADHALISMLCDLTQSNSQVINLFSRTKMWSPEREQKKNGLERYVLSTIRKIRAKQVSEQKRFANITLDFSERPQEKIRGQRNKIDSLPSGLIKDMADWIWKQSRFPLQEAALSAAFSIMSTVAGRNFQTFSSPQSGLNVWFILIAGTGTGKNEYQNGISKIIKKVSDANKFGNNFFHLFGGSMVSGQAMEDALADANRCFTYFPEFAGIYRNVTAKHPQPHHSSLKDALLNIFMQSGEENYLPRRRKAKKQDEEVDTTAIQAPCLVLGGECTPEALYGSMSRDDIETGFIQRFNLLEAEAESVSRAPNSNTRVEISQELIDDLLELFVRCDEMAASGEFVTVPANKEAEKILNDYDYEKRGQVLDGDSISKELYNRSGIKAIRIASQLALSENWRAPMMTAEHAAWAVAFVDEGDERLLAKFTTGAVGDGQVKQENEILAAFTHFGKMSTKARIKLGMNGELAANRILLSHTLLKKHVVMSPAFASAQCGAVTAFEKCLHHMMSAGQIVKVSDTEKYGGGSVWCVIK